MIKKLLIVVCILMLLGVAPTEAKAPRYTGRLCSSCGFGNKKDNCVLCGKWMSSTYYPAGLCTNCGFGNKVENCVKCGKWTGNSYYPARICGNCGFGSKKENCVKCGKWAN